MKKRNSIFVLVLIIINLVSCETDVPLINVSDNPIQKIKTIHVAEPGTIRSLLTIEERRMLTNLNVTGIIDSRDIRFLCTSMEALITLDLDSVTIAAYTGTGGASDSEHSVFYPANTIPNYSFYDYYLTRNSKTTLKNIVLPHTISSIGESAFAGCTGLSSIIIPSGLISIGESAFVGCTGLTSIEIPNSTTSIGEWAFGSCTSLTAITIPSGVITIGECAFINCSALTMITIPASVNKIGERAFDKCTNLKHFNIDSTNNYYSSIDGVLFNKDKTTLLCFPSANGDYKIPNGVIVIGNSAFYFCTNLKSISVPNSVNTIGNSAFGFCEGLISFTTPTSVTSIGTWAFNACTSLTTITIPQNVRSIGEGAFCWCPELSSIYAFSVKPINLSPSWYIFDGINTSTCILYVPMGSKSIYQTAYKWGDFKNIVESVKQ